MIEEIVIVQFTLGAHRYPLGARTSSSGRDEESPPGVCKELHHPTERERGWGEKTHITTHSYSFFLDGNSDAQEVKI